MDRRTFALTAACLLARGTAPAAPAPFRRPRRPTKITASNVAKLREVAAVAADSHKAVWSPDGKRVGFVGWQREVEVRDAETFRRLSAVGARRKLIAFAFSPLDDDVVVLSENSRSAEILNVRTGKAVILRTGNDQPSPLFSPDGKVVATGGYGTKAKLWDAATGKLLRSLDSGATEGGLTVAFSPDGATVAVGNRNSSPRLFDATTGRQRHQLEARATHGLRFRRDGKVLAAGDAFGQLWLWEASSGKRLARAKAPAEEVYDVDWSAGGDVLAAVGAGGGLMMWKAAGLKLLSQPDPTARLSSVRFSPDGTRLLVTVRPADVSGRKVSLWGVG